MRTDHANWTRTLKRLRRYMAELREYDVQVIEPPNMDVPPRERLASGGIIPATGYRYIVGEHGPEDIAPSK